jgi:hypothetical protein
MGEAETRLTVMHRGVPVGVLTVAVLGAVGAGGRRVPPPRVFAATLRGALDAAVDPPSPPPDEPFPVVAGFRPLAGYEAIRPVVRLAGDAFEHHGLLGPAGEPAAAERGRAALEAALELWEELELQDERGLPAPGRVTWLLELRPPGGAGEPYYWANVAFGRAGAPVPARLRDPAAGDAAHEPPAP